MKRGSARVARKLSSADVIDTLSDLFIARGASTHIRSDQGPEFVAEAVKGWIEGIGAGGWTASRSCFASDISFPP
jgi:hypothetical protein